MLAVIYQRSNRTIRLGDLRYYKTGTGTHLFVVNVLTYHRYSYILCNQSQHGLGWSNYYFYF